MDVEDDDDTEGFVRTSIMEEDEDDSNEPAVDNSSAKRDLRKLRKGVVNIRRSPHRPDKFKEHTLVGGSTGAKRDEDNKVVIGARSLGYIVVGVNEFYTSKKCPTCREFVGEVNLRQQILSVSSRKVIDDTDCYSNIVIPTASSPIPAPSISMDESVDASPESEQLLSREHEELICSVDEFNHPLRDWKADDARATCLFANYRRLCINALNALGPIPELPYIDIDDANILYLRGNGDEAEVPSMVGKKLRIMLESLYVDVDVTHIPRPNTNFIVASTNTQHHLIARVCQLMVDRDVNLRDVSAKEDARALLSKVVSEFPLIEVNRVEEREEENQVHANETLEDTEEEEVVLWEFGSEDEEE
ncbi:MAG: hypothetical protein JOS17DRAFT_840514 [Linnemannia elongata]|nr:MAG: hypothetical protein JOS17DRAFT_840514 [Linnemannia elongata]